MIKFLKKIFLVWIISLWIINFSNAWSYTYTWHVMRIIQTSTATTLSSFQVYMPVYWDFINYPNTQTRTFNLDCSFSNVVYSWSFVISKLYAAISNGWFDSNWSIWGYSSSMSVRYLDGLSSSTVYTWYVSSSSQYPVSASLYFQYQRPISEVSSVSFDFSCVISWTAIHDFGSSSSCDYSDYELKSNITQSYCTNKFNNLISTSSIDQNYCTSNNLCPSCQSCDYSWYVLESDITENYCINKYSNLINEEDITSWYCETEFWLIDPENCPASWGSWDINWSNFFVNSEQIQGASMIYLRLPEFLNRDYTYINSWSTLNINVENVWDTEYIEDILEVQTFHPSSEDFTQSFTWTLVLLLPYIIIVLFIMFIWKLLRWIFK